MSEVNYPKWIGRKDLSSNSKPLTRGEKARRVAQDTTSAKRQGSELEERLVAQIAAVRLPAPMREFRFHPLRKWRSDLAWPVQRVLVEVEGGSFVSGRHSRGLGMRKDAEKYNEALLLGFKVYRVTVDMIRDGSGVAVVQRALRAEGVV